MADRRQRVIPDGCVDLVWLGGELLVAGADTGPVVVAPTGDREPVNGVRLRPGAAGAVLGVPADQVRNARVPLTALWGATGIELTETLVGLDAVGRGDRLLHAVRRRRAVPDRLVRAAATRLATPRARVDAVAADLGVGVRHLHRRTVAAVGYGPKMLGRVARLRRLVTLTGLPPARRALAAGYAGQAHMCDEVRRLTGHSAVRFLEDAALTAA